MPRRACGFMTIFLVTKVASQPTEQMHRAAMQAWGRKTRITRARAATSTKITLTRIRVGATSGAGMTLAAVAILEEETSEETSKSFLDLVGKFAVKQQLD